MTPAVLKDIPRPDIALLARVRAIVELLPDDIDLGIDEDGDKVELSCHILAEALARSLEIDFVHGRFVRFAHSWLVTKYENIIDPYPILILGGPILMLGNQCNRQSPAKLLYRVPNQETDEYLREKTGASSFKAAVQKVVSAIDNLK